MEKGFHDFPGVRDKNPSNFARAVGLCPKQMTNGPCGGVTLVGCCEANADLPCPYLAILDDLPWRSPQLNRGKARGYSEGKLESALTTGEFVLVAEVYTTDSANLDDLVASYLPLKDRVTAFNLADHALATPHASTLAAAALFERAGRETDLNLTCRDRNRIGLQSDMLGAALGIKNLFCVTGDHPKLGDQPETRGVFVLNSLELIALAKRLRDDSVLFEGRRLAVEPRISIGAAANPFSPPAGLQAERIAAKVAAGANFVQTQRVFDAENFEAFVADLRDWGVLEQAFLIAGVAVATSAAQVRWLRREVPGARVPDDLIAALDALPVEEQRAAGVAYAAGLVEKLKRTDGVSGALLFSLHGEVESIPAVLGRLT